MFNSPNLIIFIIIFLSALIFLICREIACWFWKINQRITLLIEIRDLMAFNSKLPLSKFFESNEQNEENKEETPKNLDSNELYGVQQNATEVEEVEQKEEPSPSTQSKLKSWWNSGGFN
jgi:hypothetical protein